MGPEEFYYMDYLSRLNLSELRKIRISSLEWVWKGWNSGTIRRETIVSLIPYQSLTTLLSELESEERYEDCEVVWNIMNEIYNENEKRNVEQIANPFTNRGMEDW
jgi:hypothetical protein